MAHQGGPLELRKEEVKEAEECKLRGQVECVFFWHCINPDMVFFIA